MKKGVKGVNKVNKVNKVKKKIGKKKKVEDERL